MSKNKKLIRVPKRWKNIRFYISLPWLLGLIIIALFLEIIGILAETFRKLTLIFRGTERKMDKFFCKIMFVDKVSDWVKDGDK